MANKAFKTLPGVVDIPNSQNVEQFKSIIQPRWTGFQWRRINAIDITHGPAVGRWNSEAAYSVQREDNPYDPSPDKGFKLYSSSGSAHESVYEMYGNGRHMPASVWNGLGFESKFNRISGNDKHDLYIKKYAASFSHRTNNSSYRFYGWDTGNTNRPSGGYRFDKIHSSSSFTSDIRSWGPDWLFQGLIIQFGNNTGGSDTQSEVTVYNLKIGHKYSTVNSSYRYLPLSSRRWEDRNKHPISSERFCSFSNPFTA